MPIRTFAHRIRLYPDRAQAELALRTFGCKRLLWNLALEQRSTYGRRGRRIGFTSWNAELKALKAEIPFLREVPHHCMVQGLKDLEATFQRFFKGGCGYPRPKRRFDDESFRFPDPKQFKVVKDALVLPKFGRVQARIHRPIQGQLRSVTVSREGNQWYASVLVRMQVAEPPPRPMVEGGYDVGTCQPVVDSDGTVYTLPKVSPRGRERERRLQRAVARRKKGSRRREWAKAQLRALHARRARRRRAVAHQVSSRLVSKYTHLACEDLNLRNMTASAKGTVENPGRNVAQKAGLNRSILDIAPGQLRRLAAYKAEWCGTRFVAVNPAFTSQDCSECGRHPKDSVETQHLPHGRISRGQFICPLCGYAADADYNAARNIRARGRLQWSAGTATQPVAHGTVGSAVTGRGALCGPGGREPVRPRHGDRVRQSRAAWQEATTRIPHQTALRA